MYVVCLPILIHFLLPYMRERLGNDYFISSVSLKYIQKTHYTKFCDIIVCVFVCMMSEMERKINNK